MMIAAGLIDCKGQFNHHSKECTFFLALLLYLFILYHSQFCIWTTKIEKKENKNTNDGQNGLIANQYFFYTTCGLGKFILQ